MTTRDPPPATEGLRRLNGETPITVLHVDDDPEFADLVSIYLERENSDLEVLTETSGDAALERLSEVDIDCVVSDYDMPGMNGLELLDAVRDVQPRLPFILFTGKGGEEIASEAISSGVTDYLQKGAGTDQYTVLENRISNAVAQYRAEQETERGFQALETAREGISLLDEEGTFLYVNQAYADTYGYQRGELVGEHWELLYPESRVNQVYEEILPAVPDEGRWEGESVHVTKSGERLVVDHALAHAGNGTLICLIRDLTPDKETEAALERERRRFELFVDCVEEYAIFALDPEGYVTSWNTGAERIKGYSAEEIVGEHVSTFYPEERVAAGYPEELLNEALESGSVTDEGWRLRADGSRFWADVTITAVVDDDGHHRGFLKVTRDATTEHEHDLEAEAEQRFVERALDLIDDLFYVLDTDGSIARVTDRAVEVTGYSETELRSMDPLELFPADQRARVQADIERAMETGAADFEADLLTNDGQRIPYEFRKRHLPDEAGNVVGLVGIGRDVSDRKRRERQLQRQLDHFEHFGSILSHDLRTPLQTVAGRIELAQQTGDLDHLEAAQAAVDRVDTLIEDLASVMREGELVSDIEAVALETIVERAWEGLHPCETTLTVDGSATIRADAEAVTRLFENLLNNAIEHGGSRIRVGCLEHGFYIEDDGPGIPEDIRDEIFEVGYSTKDADEGTGLGLASARQIALAHGWQLTASESDTGGARFEVLDVEMA